MDQQEDEVAALQGFSCTRLLSSVAFSASVSLLFDNVTLISS